jgi:hypothetical protein
MILRLESKMHPLLDYEPFAPRRMDRTLVWPLEAPMVNPAVFRVFKDVRIESGLAEGSDLGVGR